ACGLHDETDSLTWVTKLSSRWGSISSLLWISERSCSVVDGAGMFLPFPGESCPGARRADRSRVGETTPTGKGKLARCGKERPRPSIGPDVPRGALSSLQQP